MWAPKPLGTCPAAEVAGRLGQHLHLVRTIVSHGLLGWTMTGTLEDARAAFAGRRWTEAVDSFTAVDAADPLDVEDLERLASAAQLVGEDALAAETWERAHLQLLASKDLEQAVRCAFWCAFGLMNANQMARAGGWVSRATRLLDENELDCAERGFVIVPKALRILEDGDPDRALAMFEQVLSFGRRFDDLDVIALGRLGQGRALVLMGRDAEGLALLDEAMVSVTAGELAPIVAGRIYCAVILVCQQAFDLHRAHEWTSALSSWCDAQPDIVPFRGQCLVHRSEVLQMHGDWSGAMDEAERARKRLSDPPGQPAVGMAFYQLAELFRLRGDYAEAEVAYREAMGHGRTPEPGFSLMRLMQGRLEEAATRVREATKAPSDRVTRANLLSACVEVMLAVDDQPYAEWAGAELVAIARAVNAPLLHAMSAHAEGALALHRHEAQAALNAAQRAASLWAQLAAPYERARAQVIAARACLLLGDRETALFESAAAQEAFASLGALPDLHSLDLLIPAAGTPSLAGLTRRQLEVLELVARGKTNREIAEHLYVSEHTVRRHLQNIFNRIGVTTRSAATSYAYEHNLI